MAFKYFDVDLDQVIRFYMAEGLNQDMEWTKWFVDPMQNRIIFQRWVDDKDPALDRQNETS